MVWVDEVILDLVEVTIDGGFDKNFIGTRWMIDPTTGGFEEAGHAFRGETGHGNEVLRELRT